MVDGREGLSFDWLTDRPLGRETIEFEGLKITMTELIYQSSAPR